MLNDPSFIFPALASQLAQFNSQYKRALYDIVTADSNVAVTAGAGQFQSQFDILICRPLSRMPERAADP